MDIIFDIDGTLADATHRLHFITNPNPPTSIFDVHKHPERFQFEKDWDSFLADDQVAKDDAIGPMWRSEGLICCQVADGDY